MHVVIAGGGSAGHIEPALNTADALRRADPDVGITMLGTEKGLDTQLMPARGYQPTLIPAVPLPRKPNADLVSLPSRLLGTVRQTQRVLTEAKADVVVGFGGYVSLPAYLAARRLHIPIVVHEANVRPGLANRVGARFARFVATGSPAVTIKGSSCIGMPLRPAISGLDRPAVRAEAREFFGLAPDRPTLLVTGGSQGARRINDAMRGAIPALRAAGVQVLHSYGNKNSFDVGQGPDDPPYVARPFVDRMDLAYAAADFALSRCGMMTCSEFTAVGLPSAYVPLPIGNGEQRLNAAPIVEAGGGLLIDDASLTSEWIVANVLPILMDPERLAEMGSAARRFGIRDGDDALVALVYRAAGAERPGQDGEHVGTETGQHVRTEEDQHVGTEEDQQDQHVETEENQEPAR